MCFTLHHLSPLFLRLLHFFFYFQEHPFNPIKAWYNYFHIEKNIKDRPRFALYHAVVSIVLLKY